MDPTLSLFLLAAAALAAAAAAAAAAEPAPSSCAAEIVGISACLPLVVAAPPITAAANATAAAAAAAEAAPSDACCDAFLRGLVGGGAACLCHLLRDPLLLGFPINASRIASLFSSCGAPNPSDSADSSFSEMCNESQSLPPFRSITWNDTSIPSPASSEETINPSSANLTRPAPVPICPPVACPKPSEPDLAPQPRPDASARSPLDSATPLIFAVLAFFIIEAMSRAAD
uniref:Bifunctional inhibitor/plant lipid transfer protein/seed storage helical domain-containing protein n=1 Tax=Ananas comosus var. bracteatus TaxID=296719 RepID=A0A6V7QF60_ANACO|nr:unnamed protein product [Ananas comosus var. bracteatus]